MKHRLKYILIPLALILALTIVVWLLLCQGFSNAYRTTTNTETAALIGSALEISPELDHGEIVRILRNNPTIDPEVVQRGNQILREYGYFADDYASATTQVAMSQFFLVGGILLVVVIATTVGCFAIFDYRRERRIKQLISYLQDLDHKVYSLRLDENCEDELSLLTNELYKITISLQETAELNRRHSKNLETALADISHQLRTPLTSLQLAVDSIYENPHMSPSVRQDLLRSISHQVESMSSLVTTLLHLAQFDNGSITLQCAPISARDLLAPVLQNLAILAELSDVTVKLSGDLTRKLSIDARWQREALTNIIKNCIEHSPVGATVTIKAETCPLFTRIHISDQGEGIKKSELKRIFQRFYQIPGSNQDGIGIGLAFAKTIIEANGGQITVHSTPGKGTEFSVAYFN